ncbi:unnamed protein product [Effrenium voratum]|nr:unnamed protein product [Effrenium voratum]
MALGSPFVYRSALMVTHLPLIRGLEVRCSDPVLNAQLYSNRAHVRLLLRQFVEAVDDCRKAIEQDPKNIKAYWRAARGSLQLDLCRNGMDFCEEGLQMAPGDADLKKLRDACAEKLAGQQQRRQAQAAAHRDFNADEAMAVQDKVTALNEQLARLKASLAGKQRQRMRMELTQKTIEETPPETKLYRGVGRCFLLGERPSMLDEMKSTLDGIDEELPKMQRASQELEKRKEDAEKELREMISAFRQQTDGFLDRKDLKKPGPCGSLRRGAMFRGASIFRADFEGAAPGSRLPVYAQSEFKFALPDACAEKIMTLLVPAGAKGVKKDDFQRVKVQVGIAREQKIDLERKKKREQRELEIEEMKEKMKGSIEEMTSKVGEVEELSKTMKAMAVLLLHGKPPRQPPPTPAPPSPKKTLRQPTPFWAPPSPKRPPPTPAAPAAPDFVVGELCAGEAAKAKLRWVQRRGLWRDTGVSVLAVVWAEMQVETRNVQLARLMKEMKDALTFQLGEGAVIDVLDDVSRPGRVYVCLFTKAEECLDIRGQWKPYTLGQAQVTWADTIDTASSHFGPRLRSCWNPQHASISAVSLELPAAWAFRNLQGEKVCKCSAGTHWHDFAQLFGDVKEVTLVRLGDVAHLVIDFTSNRGAWGVYKALTGRALHNPMAARMKPEFAFALVRAAYGVYSALLTRAVRGGSSARQSWPSLARPLKTPEDRLAGPVFELCPLKWGVAPSQERLQIAHWGPSLLGIGRERSRHLCIGQEGLGISNLHAELKLMSPVSGDDFHEKRLFVRDLSKNGSFVNEQRVPKGNWVELRDKDVLRLAELPQYVVHRFEHFDPAQMAAALGAPGKGPEEEPELDMPACPFFLDAAKVPGQPWAEVPRLPPEDAPTRSEIFAGGPGSAVQAASDRLRWASDGLAGRSWRANASLHAEKNAAQQALKSPEVKSTELIAKLQELASQSAEVVEKSVALRKAMNELKEGAEKEVVRWLQTELKPLFAKCKSAEQAAGQSSQFVKRQRLTADKRQRSELEQLQRQALDVIRQYQKAKDIANDGVFGEMSAAGEEESVVSESSFVAFFEKCRQECGNGEAVKMPAEEDLRRLLTYWDEAGAGHLSEERVGEILRRFMKVVTKTTLTKGVSIKDSEGIRKLEVNEVVELLGQEAQEPEVEVMRVKVRVLNDGTEGWVTLSGNQGTHYLKEGGGTFKVVKETLLMEEFDIASGAKDTDRKLKVGELVEARSWMKKHEESGLTRLRCKALSDGAVGWATVVGNQGTKYLEVK